MTDWLDEETLDLVDSDPEMARLKPAKAGSPINSHKCWELGYYTPYFAVDTQTVLERIRRTFILTGKLKDGHQPDLWCPFWTATTLVFLIAASGPVDYYLETGEVVSVDVHRIVSAASLLYSSIVMIPVVLYCYLN